VRKIILAFFLVVCLSVPARAARFVEIYGDNKRLMYVDVDSIEDRDEYLLVWVKSVFLGEEKEEMDRLFEDSMDYSLHSYALNKNLKQMQTLSSVIYNIKGVISWQTSDNFSRYNFDEIVPNSLGEVVYDSVIDYLDTGRLNSPPPEISTPKEQSINIDEAAVDYLGLLTSATKTPDGGFLILDVTPNGLSDSAGIKKGDVLIKIDTYDLKEFDLDRISSYIALRIDQQAIIKTTIIRDGAAKVIEIQL
jgi:C-terminal processing protease CtpA/Prc